MMIRISDEAHKKLKVLSSTTNKDMSKILNDLILEDRNEEPIMKLIQAFDKFLEGAGAPGKFEAARDVLKPVL